MNPDHVYTQLVPVFADSAGKGRHAHPPPSSLTDLVALVDREVPKSSHGSGHCLSVTTS